jgi:hypothetical protein
MVDVARAFPGIQFLAFTKMHHLDYSSAPKNLTVVFSMFPGMPKPKANMPIAWVQDGTEKRIPESAQHGTDSVTWTW